MFGDRPFVEEIRGDSFQDQSKRLATDYQLERWFLMSDLYLYLHLKERSWHRQFPKRLPASWRLQGEVSLFSLQISIWFFGFDPTFFGWKIWILG